MLLDQLLLPGKHRGKQCGGKRDEKLSSINTITVYGASVMTLTPCLPAILCWNEHLVVDIKFHLELLELDTVDDASRIAINTVYKVCSF